MSKQQTSQTIFDAPCRPQDQYNLSIKHKILLLKLWQGAADAEVRYAAYNLLIAHYQVEKNELMS